MTPDVIETPTAVINSDRQPPAARVPNGPEISPTGAIASTGRP